MESKMRVGAYYVDNEENIYKCLAIYSNHHYSEAVMQLTGDLSSQASFYFVFYRSNYAWVDRENPDYKLMEETYIFPSLVESVQ